MKDFYLADSFLAHFDELKLNLPQSLLLHGETGVGLSTVAHQLAGKNPRVFQPIDKHGEVDMIGGTISVSAIRQLYEQTRAKTTDRQVIIIEHADQMSIGAQNAFLKLLEEPSASVHFILTSYHKDSLLPTILSRVQAYHAPRISTAQSMKLLRTFGLDENTQRQLLFVAGGRPSMLTNMGNDSNLRQQTVDLMTDARNFLNANSYQALTYALKYASSRQQAERFIDAVMTILTHSLYSAPTHSSLQRAQRLDKVKSALGSNANPRLQMMRLVLS